MGSGTLANLVTVAAAVAVAVLLLCSGGARAQAPAPAPGQQSDDCLNSLLDISDCLTYVEKGSNQTKPDKGCCPGMAKLVASNPTCLCQVLHNSTDIVGVEVDIKKALNLPKVCHVSTPPFTLCADIGYPVSGLPPSPSPSPSRGPSASGSSDNGSSGTVMPSSAPEVMKPKSSAGGIMDATSIKGLVVTLLLGLSTVTLAIF